MYNTAQWFLFFYIYCFLGWIWESAYVSVRAREWVNRGFIHGPFLPIYGSGAIVILLSTLGVRDNIWLIYLFGMISSTILEYFTGDAMEKLFHVRYWDYTRHKFNLKGHICLMVSLAWRAFSILLVKVLHPPIEDLVMSIPMTAVDITAFALTIYVAVDMTVSLNEAMDLKATLIKLAESNEEIRKLQNRIDAVAAMAEEDLRKFKEEQAAKKKTRKERFAENVQEARARSLARLENLSQQIFDYFTNTEANSVDLTDYLNRVEVEKRKILSRTDREYNHLAKILRRNPGAVSKHHREELDSLLNMLKK